MMDNIGAQSPLAATAAACICLAFVVGLILAAARLAKRLPALRTLGQAGGGIALVGSLALDRTHRLHLVQIGDEQALVVTGGAAAVLTLPRAC
jgi:flagellar biogenesis protein FliO